LLLGHPNAKLGAMPIPALEERGFLPVGIHDCALVEVKAVFGCFRGSDQRPRLFSKLEAFLSEVANSSLIVAVLLDGSFVTAKPDPNDIDLLVVVPSGHDFSADLSTSDYNLLSKNRARRLFGFDVLVAAEDSEQYYRYVRFFQQIRFEPALRKGILRLRL
jgi:hypothetical protein